MFGPGGQQQTVKTWGMRGAYTHNWDPYWNTSVYGAYAAVMYNDRLSRSSAASAASVVRSALPSVAALA